MAETEINVTSRPAIVSTALGAIVQGWPILAAAVTFGVWLVRLENGTNTNTDAIAKSSLIGGDARWLAEQKPQNDRVEDRRRPHREPPTVRHAGGERPKPEGHPHR